MPKKLAIQPSQLSKDATVKAIAAQLAGKKAQAKEQTWTKAFAASGGKIGGKVR